MALAQIKALISDMDGVLWRGTEVLAGVVELFEFLQGQGIKIVLATNNSGKHPQEYVERLSKIGISGLVAEQIITSGTATADYLKTRYPLGTRLYVIGNDGLKRVLTETGFVLADDDVQAVVAGIDSSFTYEKARHATLLIRNQGVAFIGTNPDVTFPSPEGLLPGAGSIIGMIRIASGVEPVIIGKPARAMFDVALQRLGTSPQETLMLGDRLDTDIAGADAVGIQTAMVLTGVSEEADIATVQPHYIFADLPALLAQWKQSL